MKLDKPLPVPSILLEAYADWQWEVVSQLAPHSVTYRLSHPCGTVRYLKVAEASWYPRLPDERVCLQWAQTYLPVPKVLESGSEDGVSWMVTEALPGVDATNAQLRKHPVRLVQILAQGLRQFHQVPVSDCPFQFLLEVAFAHVEQRASQGLIDPARDFHPEHQHLTVATALQQLQRTRPPSEDLVVCHGDYCLPNVLIDDDCVVGFVDLGELALADRWWDLAIATWSTVWNLGQGFEGTFLVAYGIEPDPARIAFYRLLYDLVS